MPYKDPVRQREYIRTFGRRRLAAARERLGGRCIDCGATERLEFDHVDRTTKLAAVTHLQNKRREIFDAEVAKCVLRCHICHLARTRRERHFRSTAPCGTDSAYQRGCRCRPCSDAHYDAWKEWKERTEFVQPPRSERAAARRARAS